jgi:hypothetical protein
MDILLLRLIFIFLQCIVPCKYIYTSCVNQNGEKFTHAELEKMNKDNERFCQENEKEV